MSNVKKRGSVSLPNDLWDWLDAEAKKEGRTRNGLIGWLIEKAKRASIPPIPNKNTPNH